MKDKILKVIFALLLIALIIFSCVGIFTLFNSLVAYKTASGNDWLGFGGGIVGSIIAGLIAVITFYYTIKNTNKNQEKAHKLQMSLKVEDNLNRKFETERSVLAITYNQLESFLFTVSNISNQNDDYIAIKNDYFRLYKEVLNSINNIRFNSEIFDDRSSCENCQICEIKTYGILVKSATDIQKEITAIDKECRKILAHLDQALRTAAESNQLIDEKSTLQKININNEQILSTKDNQVLEPIDYITPNSANLNDEQNKLLQEIKQNNERIEKIDESIMKNLNFIKEQSDLARNKATQIDANNKTQLYILIRKYFAAYNLYIKEMVYAVQKNGKKPNSSCAKLDFEKNHKTED